jgi:hypothetical protein
MKKLRLMCDYFCYPIWHDDGKMSGEFGDIDPRTLSISRVLAEELIAWSDSFDRGLDMDDPASIKWWWLLASVGTVAAVSMAARWL